MATYAKGEDARYYADRVKEDDVVSLPSGLLYKILKSGKAGAPSPNKDTPCLCHYKGCTITGQEFDSSYKRGKPTTFAPNQVIKAWTEAMQLMKEGDKWELICPSNIAYGDKDKGAIIYGGATLVFEMELIKCQFPRTVKEIFADAKLMDGKTEANASEALAGKNVALYFSAHWCNPCRQFTPKLVQVYNSMKAQVAAGTRKDNFEFVFVSGDEDQESFNEYFLSMPWKALKFSDRQANSDLNKLFGVRGIPSLVTLMNIESGTIVNSSAVGQAMADLEGKKFPWEPEALMDINAGPEGLNESTCICAMLGGVDKATKAAVKADLMAVATKYAAAAKAAGTKRKYCFFFEDKKDNISMQVRKLTKASDGSVVVLDIPAGGKYYTAAAKHSGNIQLLIDDYEGSNLTAKQMMRQ